MVFYKKKGKLTYYLLTLQFQTTNIRQLYLEQLKNTTHSIYVNTRFDLDNCTYYFSPILINKYFNAFYHYAKFINFEYGFHNFYKLMHD